MGADDLDGVRRVCPACRGTGLRAFSEGERMRARRMQLRISLRAMARAMRISHPVLYEQERSLRRWSPGFRARYQRALRRIEEES